MRRLFCVVLAVAFLLTGTPLHAQDEFGGFQQYVDKDSLKPFARDLGAVLGASTFHSGRSLGFSGFDVGVRGGLMLRPDKKDTVLTSRGGAFGMPWVQAEIGLPFNLDGFIRGISFQGLTIAGGGLRYGLNKASDVQLHPQFLLSWSGHSVSHRDFSASHFGLNLVASVLYRTMTPYVAVGGDRTNVVVRCVPAKDPTLQGATVAVLVPRATVGMSMRPKPYLYLNGAATYTNKNVGFDTGLGIRF